MGWSIRTKKGAELYDGITGTANDYMRDTIRERYCDLPAVIPLTQTRENLGKWAERINLYRAANDTEFPNIPTESPNLELKVIDLLSEIFKHRS